MQVSVTNLFIERNLWDVTILSSSLEIVLAANKNFNEQLLNGKPLMRNFKLILFYFISLHLCTPSPTMCDIH